MPRYFFHLQQSGTRLIDEEGQLLRDLDEAWEAARAAANALMDAEPGQPEWLLSRFEVTDDKGTILLEFSFAETTGGTEQQN